MFFDNMVINSYHYFSYVYPTMDELASQINYVLVHFGIKSFIGFGVGAGANILARFAYAYPSKVRNNTSQPIDMRI